jgi:hypothetical protein
VTKTPLKKEFEAPISTDFFRLSTAFDEDIRNAGMMLKTRLKMKVPVMEIVRKEGEKSKCELK